MVKFINRNTAATVAARNTKLHRNGVENFETGFGAGLLTQDQIRKAIVIRW